MSPSVYRPSGLAQCFKLSEGVNCVSLFAAGLPVESSTHFANERLGLLATSDANTVEVVYRSRLSLAVLFRGENGPGGWAMREAEDNPNRTEYVWLFDVDLKVTERFF